MINYKLNYYTRKHYIVRDLSLTEFDSFKQDSEYVLFYLHIEELYTIFKLNIGEFWKYLLELSEYHRLNFVYEYDELLEPRVIVNQKLSNILTSFKSYEDLIRSHISHNENLIGNMNSSIDQLFSKVYDDYFGYRFMSRLRNYVQHFNLPIQSVTFRSKMINIPLKIGAFTVEPNFEKAELLKFKKWNTVESEIQKLGDNISCKPIVDDFYTSMNILHENFRNIFYTKYKEVKIRIENLISEANTHFQNQLDPNHEITVYLTSFNDETVVDNIWVPDEMIKRIDKMVTKNKLRTNLNYSFSTMQSFD